ncbi:MAG TPA: VWA domain-containing protein [Chitinophagales bacterium]|nr:VWA domain-containing protein [Chitinophagales bacterium]
MHQKIILPAILLLISITVSAQTAAPNPDLVPGCSMNILFIMDESGSIAGYGNGTSNVSNQVRAGAAGLLNALSGTGSRVAILEFNTAARRAVIGGTTAYQIVDASTINTFLDYINDPEGNSTAESNHYDPEDYISTPQNTFTNWEDALILAKNVNTSDGAAQLIVFFTDGIPTAYNKSTGGFTTGTTSAIITNALNKATTAANNVKAQGSHIFAIGFPNPNLPEGNLQTISGPERYPDLQPDFTKGDYSVSSSQTLQQDIHRIGIVVCHADLRLTKTVNAATSCLGNNVVFTLSIINEGLLNATGVVVKDYLPSGYNYVSNNGGAAFSAGTVTWNVGNLNYLQTKTLQITASVKASGSYTNTAEVTASNQDDGDSFPNNGNAAEDDFASAGIISLLNCDDGNACTIDDCANGACTHAQNPACCSTSTDCNDNNICTVDDCTNGLCTFTQSGNCCLTNADCADSDGCTLDICQPSGVCFHETNCDDGNACTIDACDNGTCAHTTPDCNDNDACTNDICMNGSCSHASINCFDNNSCTQDACSNGICTHTPVVCSDANPCTNDLCAGGFCRFLAKNCNDGNPCTSDACVNGSCINTFINCDDNNPCTTDTCVYGICAHPALNCDDGSANTIDACVSGECIHTFISCENPAPLKILFILDESGSINGFGTGTTNVSAQVRNGASSLFNSLNGTNTKVAVIEFNTSARRAVIGGSTAYQQINASTLPAFLDYISDNNFSADNNHYDPEDYISNQSGTFTNWDDALQLTQSINTSEGTATFVIFFTDGVPTAYNTSNNTVTTGSGSAFEAIALAEAVTSANNVKAQGSHIFVVGIPNPSLPESNVKQISGPSRYPDIEPVFSNADYSISTSQSLQNDLGKIGGLLCRADLSLKKTVNQPVACTGQTIIFTIEITNGGLESATGVQVKDYLPDGFTYVSNDGGALFSAGTLTWNVGILLNGQTKTLRITTAINATGNYKNVAEVTASDLEDSDSHPNNYNGSNPAEDDEAVATVVMNCNCYLKVTSLTLMYEGLFGEAGELFDGKVISRDTLCRFNVRANLCQSPVGSVKFLLNGTVFRTENTPPYALYGDQPAGFYLPWIPNPGNYTLTAVAYSGSGGSGTPGTSYTVRFTVLAGATNTACLAPPKIDCAGKVNGTAAPDGCGICSGGTSGHLANSDKDRCGVCFGDGTSCCFTDDECSDNNLCTFDICNNSACEFISNVVDDGNACMLDGCDPQSGEFFSLPVNCDDNNTCTTDDCNSGSGCQHTAAEGCCVSPVDCNDNDACTANECSNNQCIFTPANCDDLISCTTDGCDNQTGCQHTPGYNCCITPADCSDNNACTSDDCRNNQCSYNAVNCDDNNVCTIDNCNNQAGCQHALIQSCCLTNTECNDGNPCTADACISNTCSYAAISSQPSYLKVVNPSTSYRKMRLGYSSTGLFSPKYHVSAGGNNQLCITLKDASGTAQWNKIKVKPQGASSPIIYLGTYIPPNPGTDYFTACIPLSVFTANDFTQISYLELQCNNAAAFEIHIQKVEFTGGATPFLWFGDPKVDNFHDGTTGSTNELITTTVPGQPCGAPKHSGDDVAEMSNWNKEETSLIALPNPFNNNREETFLNAAPNPFSERVTILFSVTTSEKVRLEIYSIDGRMRSKLFEGQAYPSEMNSVEFNGSNLSKGMYFCRLVTEGGAIYNQKVLLLK